ncbi:MAG: hypothetical protein AB7O04_06070 [Hyphomonadaceae bacterium]
MGVSLRVQPKYSVSQKSKLIETFRAIISRLSECRGKPLSPQAISETIEDVVMAFSHWTDVDDPLLIKVFKRGSLDPHTIRKLMDCELGFNLHEVQAGSIRVLDAFIQLVAIDPPPHVADCLRE